jgi:predicted transcriptional regulator of viral defense system
LVARVAAVQHTVVSHEQLSACGVRGNAVTTRVKNGRLHRQHIGVYSVGQPTLTKEGRWMAAVLASGASAVLSHGDAARLWGLWDQALGPRVDVSTPQRTRKGAPGIRLHRVRHLPADERTEVEGIPVTSIARTLIDLTDMFGRERLTRWIREAEYLGVLDLEAVDQAIANATGRRRLPTLIAAVEAHRPGQIVRQELEHRFLELCRRYDVPIPDTNVPMIVAGRSRSVDCLWREQQVVVELDGRSAHDNPAAFENDRARDAALTAAGYRLLHYTWRRVTTEGRAIARELRAVLAAPQSSAPSSRSTLRAIASEDA